MLTINVKWKKTIIFISIVLAFVSSTSLAHRIRNKSVFLLFTLDTFYVWNIKREKNY